MVAFTVLDLTRAYAAAEEHGRPKQAALLRRGLELGLFLWGEDPRDYSEDEADIVLQKLALPAHDVEPVAPDILL